MHRVLSRLVSRRTATVNQFRAFLIEQGITVRRGLSALRYSLLIILKNRAYEISPRMHKLILILRQDWIWVDERIRMTPSEIEDVGKAEASCQRLMTIPPSRHANIPCRAVGIGPIISTAMVAAVGKGEAYDRGRDLAASC